VTRAHFYQKKRKTKFLKHLVPKSQSKTTKPPSTSTRTTRKDTKDRHPHMHLFRTAGTYILQDRINPCLSLVAMPKIAECTHVRSSVPPSFFVSFLRLSATGDGNGKVMGDMVGQLWNPSSLDDESERSEPQVSGRSTRFFQATWNVSLGYIRVLLRKHGMYE
jgi:hypothetical protein